MQLSQWWQLSLMRGMASGGPQVAEDETHPLYSRNCYDDTSMPYQMAEP